MTPGERRPREGRCERCDRPLTDLVWGNDFGDHFGWYEDEATPTTCIGVDVLCDGVEIDWRARALAAESIAARVDESLRNGWIDRDLAAELDRRVEREREEGNQREALAVSMWHEVETAALAAARGDEMPRSGMTESGINVFYAVEDALARAWAEGAQHALLAAAWRVGRVADGVEGTTVDPAAQRAMREAERLVVALAEEADRGP